MAEDITEAELARIEREIPIARCLLAYGQETTTKELGEITPVAMKAIRADRLLYADMPRLIAALRAQQAELQRLKDEYEPEDVYEPAPMTPEREAAWRAERNRVRIENAAMMPSFTPDAPWTPEDVAKLRPHDRGYFTDRWLALHDAQQAEAAAWQARAVALAAAADTFLLTLDATEGVFPLTGSLTDAWHERTYACHALNQAIQAVPADLLARQQRERAVVEAANEYAVAAEAMSEDFRNRREYDEAHQRERRASHALRLVVRDLAVLDATATQEQEGERMTRAIREAVVEENRKAAGWRGQEQEQP